MLLGVEEDNISNATWMCSLVQIDVQSLCCFRTCILSSVRLKNWAVCRENMHANYVSVK